MTLPSSKILKASKSLVAAANIKNQSPNTEQGQQQSVNIVVNSSTPDLRAQQSQSPQLENPSPQLENPAIYPDQEDNPYKNINLRDLQEAQNTTDELSKLIQEKDNIIKAESIIIDIYKNNPLIINKYLITDEETLGELIRLLTNASEVSIELADIECTCISANYQTIKRIYLTVEGQIYSLELCPAVMSFLENFKISLSFVKI